MMDEFRSHDPQPNSQERAWMASDPLSVLVRLAALASLAVAIGMTASHGINNEPQKAQTVATTAP